MQYQPPMTDKPGSAPCLLQQWDTDFFHRRIARVCGDTLNEEQALQIDDWSRDHRIQALYFLSRADDPATIQTAEKHGFGLVDIRVTLDCLLNSSHHPVRPDPPTGISIRPVQANDLAGLQLMARTVHSDTRFFKDSHFPSQRAEDLYSTWITLEAQGRAQIVWVAASVANQPLGYISCHLDAARRQGQIGLVGVSPQARRMGIGKNLVLAAMDWFRTQGAQAVAVVTQGNNRAAQRLYQQCGFLTRDLQIWYHKWYPILD
jgi:ribosomal protein S18 acetylase RimI-like enzyme